MLRPKHMRQKIFFLAATVSLVLLVSTLTLWLQSYRSSPKFRWGDHFDSGYGWHMYVNELACHRGTIFYIHSTPPMVSLSNRTGNTVSETRILGMHIERGYWGLVPDGDRTAYRCLVSFPGWYAPVAASILPIAWLGASWRKHRRRCAAACPICGYDLRATPERCPECGTKFVAST